MKLRSWILLLNAAAVCGLAPRNMRAQAPPGPLPQVTPRDAPPQPDAKPAKPLPAPRETILGAWKLNLEDSDDPRKKMQQARGNGGRGGYGGGPRIGGYPGAGIGRGGYGGRGESDEEREKMQELMRPANALAVSMTGAEVDVIDDANRKRALKTDGSKLQKSKDPNYQEIAAHWEGKSLVTDEKDPRGNKMSRRYELSSDGRQLFETIHLTAGRSQTPVVIRYVYDEAPGTPSGR
jgi:hypothetical protein